MVMGSRPGDRTGPGHRGASGHAAADGCVVQMKQSSPAIGTVMTAGNAVPANAAGLLTEINPDSYYVNADGTVSETGAGSSAPQGYVVLPWSAIARTGRCNLTC